MHVRISGTPSRVDLKPGHLADEGPFQAVAGSFYLAGIMDHHFEWRSGNYLVDEFNVDAVGAGVVGGECDVVETVAGRSDGGFYGSVVG